MMIVKRRNMLPWLLSRWRNMRALLLTMDRGMTIGVVRVAVLVSVPREGIVVTFIYRLLKRSRRALFLRNKRSSIDSTSHQAARGCLCERFSDYSSGSLTIFWMFWVESPPIWTILFFSIFKALDFVAIVSVFTSPRIPRTVVFV